MSDASKPCRICGHSTLLPDQICGVCELSLKEKAAPQPPQCRESITMGHGYQPRCTLTEGHGGPCDGGEWYGGKRLQWHPQRVL